MAKKKEKREYDIALSFAGQDREYVSAVADYLRFFDVKVFYDTWEQHNLLGENLYSYLADIYENKAKYAVLFLSKHYIKRAWPKHELRFVQAREFFSDQPYLLPIRIDSTKIPGIPATTGYLDASKYEPSSVALILLRRLGYALKRGSVDEYILEKDTIYRIYWNGRVRVRTRYKSIWLGENPINRFHPGVWSPDGSTLNVYSFVASDKQGKLRVNLDSKTESSHLYTVYYRKEQQYGEVSEFTIEYVCDNYFTDLLQPCSDDFQVGLPTFRISRKYIFPKNCKLSSFEIMRRSGRRKVSQIFSTNKEFGSPVVTYLYDKPETGSKYEVFFSISR